MNPPRLLIAGCGGDSGKTLVTLGLIRTWRHKDIKIVPFKKGPDYIDPAWLTLASGVETHNLDTWMMGREGVLRSFTRYSRPDALNLIEGNRGLHDGGDARGTHSSAVIARLLKTPVVLVLPVNKVTRTAAAFVLGVKLLDENVRIAGVVLNLVGGERHEAVVRRAVEDETGVPVLGAVPRRRREILPDRHLGLVTPSEHAQADQAIEVACSMVRDTIDTDRLLRIAHDTDDLTGTVSAEPVHEIHDRNIRIGYFAGSAFTFYYPENLEDLKASGSSLVKINPLEAPAMPEIDALYIGGGFPETHAASLSGNQRFMQSVAEAAARGLPVWAECGGLMFLARRLEWRGRSYPMAGVLPVDVKVQERPQGHGYQEIEVDADNPFLRIGTRIRGHEFHYSRVISHAEPPTVFRVRRGTGIGGNRDGIRINNTLASYLHVHSSAAPEWCDGMIKAAMNYNVSHFQK